MLEDSKRFGSKVWVTLPHKEPQPAEAVAEDKEIWN